MLDHTVHNMYIIPTYQILINFCCIFLIFLEQLILIKPIYTNGFRRI